MSTNELIEQGKKKRERILEFILRHIEEKKIPPTIREIKESLGSSTTSQITYHLRKLEVEGSIELEPKISRGIRISDQMTRLLYSIEYRCIYPFGCTFTSKKPGSCSLHGTELILFISRKR